MNIYLVKRNIGREYDVFDSFIVITINEKSARETHPNEDVKTKEEWKDYYSWVDYEDINLLEVILIGVAEKNINKGVLITSYNAG